MHPPWSMIIFTVLAGAAQGLMLALVGLDTLAALRGAAPPPQGFLLGGAGLVIASGGAGLVAATFHLGHPLRAWRAVAMWRTSWLSREVIALPAFLLCVAGWALAVRAAAPTLAWGAAAAVLALALYLCTGMIYAAVKAMRQWAHPVTPLNFALMGLASGTLLAAWLASGFGVAEVAGLLRAALWLTFAATVTRAWAWRRNLTLAPSTTLQTAIGVRHPRIVLKASGAMGGTFNTREFSHGRSVVFEQRMRWSALALGALVPGILIVLTINATAISTATPALACAAQLLGLLAERWCFFAEARHPQNLYTGR